VYIQVFTPADVSLTQLQSAVGVLRKKVQVCTHVYVWFFLGSSKHKIGLCLAEEFSGQGL